MRPAGSFGSIAGTQERRLTGTRLLWLWRSEPVRRRPAAFVDIADTQLVDAKDSSWPSL